LKKKECEAGEDLTIFIIAFEKNPMVSGIYFIFQSGKNKIQMYTHKIQIQPNNVCNTTTVDHQSITNPCFVHNKNGCTRVYVIIGLVSYLPKVGGSVASVTVSLALACEPLVVLAPV
jgi:hypothetical protein